MKFYSDKVILAGLKPQMRQALLAANKVMKEDYRKELVVTCGLNGTHSAGSMHYYGYAIDIRCNYLRDEKQMREATESIQVLLLENYDVIFEGNHIHIEYDPKDVSLRYKMGFEG